MDASSLDKAISILEKSIADAASSSESLEYWLPRVTFLVGLGVLLELIEIVHNHREEKRNWSSWHGASPPKPSWRMFSISALAVLLVTAGVFGELWIGLLLGNINGDIRDKTIKLVGFVDQKSAEAGENAELAQSYISELEAETAEAERQTALATKQTEELKSENLRLETLIQPRELTSQQLSDIRRELGPFRGRTVSVRSFSYDVESARLGRAVLSALSNAGITALDNLGKTLIIGMPLEGIYVLGPFNARQQIQPDLMSALARCPFGLSVRAMSDADALRLFAPSMSSATNDRRTRVGSLVEVLVGAKPLPEHR